MNKFTRKTVDKSIEIKGYSFEVTPRRILSKKLMNTKHSMIIQPAEIGAGITFYNQNFIETPIPLNIYHTYSRDDGIGRSVALSDKKDTNLDDLIPKKGEAIRIHIVEHILAALHYKGITDANIYIEGSEENPTEVYVPTEGAGISHYIKAIKNNIFDSGIRVRPIQFKEEATFSYERKGKIGIVSIKPANELEMNINQSDLGSIKLSSSPIVSANVYKDIEKHLAARPVARVNELLINLAWKILNKQGYKGICEDNYIIANRGISVEELTARMAPQYQEGQNEPVAHGMLDRYGELYTLGGLPVQGSLSAHHANHPTSIKGLKQFVKEGEIYIPK